MNIIAIIDELNEQNGSNYKLGVLKKHKENVLLQRVLQMTQDRVKFTYGLSMKQWNKGDKRDAIFAENKTVKYTLDNALDFMADMLATRTFTGNEAIEKMHEIFMGLSVDDTTVATRVLNRDLRINLGRTQVNKVFSGLIQKPVYMRCGIYGEDTAKKINPKGAFIQLKADGTYREFCIENGVVSCTSRSGEEYEYPKIYEEMVNKHYPDGHYFGELTIALHKNNICILKDMYPEHAIMLQNLLDNGIKVLPRQISNGIINSIAQS